MQVVSRQVAAKNSSPVRRQRISNQRGEVNFIAGWSRSSQHATIRYIVRYTYRYPIMLNNGYEYRIVHSSLCNVSLIIYCRPGSYTSKSNALTTIVAWDARHNQIKRAYFINLETRPEKRKRNRFSAVTIFFGVSLLIQEGFSDFWKSFALTVLINYFCSRLDSLVSYNCSHNNIDTKGGKN